MSQHALPYRPDIDGLRAIAVLSVVLYHFGFTGITGGFVGVDVFFVISGFLIGGQLWREQDATGRIALKDFYLRRIRRLMPAYVAMAIGSVFIAWFVLLPYQFRDFGKQLIVATVYLSNVQFWREAGYFDSASEEKPLLHTWSLSVEEQFYILLPVFLIISQALVPRMRLPLLYLVFSASAIACIFYTNFNPVSTFYLIQYRIWELLAGVLLAIKLANGWELKRGSFAISAAGLILVVYAFLTTQAGPHFPGWQALIPVVGTLLLLAGGTKENLLTHALSMRGPAFIGKISYSLYLWHWPVFVFAYYWRDGFSGPLETALWITIPFLLATFSWRFIERPFRQGWPNGRSMASLSIAASIILLGVGGWIFKSGGSLERFTPDVRTHITAANGFFQDFSNCYTSSDGYFAGIEVCPIGPEGDPELLVWGDSHLGAFKPGLDQAAREAGRPGLLIWRAGCPPLFGIEKRESYATSAQDASCSIANEQIAEAITKAEYKDILLIGRWSYYAEGTGVGLDEENTISVSPSFSEAVARTTQAIAATGANLHVLRQVPEIPLYDSRYIARALAHGRVTPEKAQQLATVPKTAAMERARSGEAPWQELAAQKHITLLNPWPEICSEETCFALPNGEPHYFDNNHVSKVGALKLRHLFSKVLEK